MLVQRGRDDRVVSLAEHCAIERVHERIAVLRTDHDQRIEAWDEMGRVAERLDAPQHREARARLHFQRGQLGLAIALENGEQDFVLEINPQFELAMTLDPENPFVPVWKDSMDIAMANVLGDDEALMRCLQEEIEKFLLDDTAKISPGKTKRITPKSQAGKRRRSLVKFEDDDDNEDPDDGDWDHTQEDEDEDFDEDDAAPKKRRDDMNAAREKWSEPAPAPSNTVPLTLAGMAPASAAPGAPVPEDKLLTALQLKGDDGATAKELAGFLKMGKSEVNKALYRLQSSGRVRSDGAGGGDAFGNGVSLFHDFIEGSALAERDAEGHVT